MSKRTSKTTVTKPAPRTSALAKPEQPIPYKPTGGPRTLADLGLTPERAWALHRISVQCPVRNVAPLSDGIKAGKVRVLHESFGLVVFYVAANLIEGGKETDEYTHDVVAVADVEGAVVGEAGCIAWRTIGYLSGGERWVDAVDIIGGAGSYWDVTGKAVA